MVSGRAVECFRVSGLKLQLSTGEQIGRPPRDLTEPDWPKMAAEMKRKGVTLVLLWEEYCAAHPTAMATPGSANATASSRTASARGIATAMRPAR